MKPFNLGGTSRRIGPLIAGLAISALCCQMWLSDSEGQNQAVDERLLSANTRFGFKLFAEIIKQDFGKNVFVSPSSVAMALAMTYNGAKEETREAMARTLELQEMSLAEVNQANAALKIALENLDPKIQLNIANSLWAREDISFKPDFVERNKEFYRAEVELLDFADPSAPLLINSWVNEKTNGKITKIIDEIAQDAILFLINAIYFKGTWTVKFDSAKTIDREFTLLSGDKKNHPMMHQSGHYPYYKGDNFQAVSLPYGNGTVSMYIFLPDTDSNLKGFLDSLHAENWKRWMPQFHDMEGDIALPRFKLEYELALKDVLSALGMGVAFDRRRANFAEMCQFTPGANVFFKEVKHKTFVEVNEEGTEAAAVTAVEIAITAVRPTFRMIVDRPFFCAIVDNATGSILFMGAIVDPT